MSSIWFLRLMLVNIILVTAILGWLCFIDGYWVVAVGVWYITSEFLKALVLAERCIWRFRRRGQWSKGEPVVLSDLRAMLEADVGEQLVVEINAEGGFNERRKS